MRTSPLPSPNSPPLVVIAFVMVVFMFGYAPSSADKAGALAAAAALMEVFGIIFMMIITLEIINIVMFAFMTKTTTETAL